MAWSCCCWSLLALGLDLIETQLFQLDEERKQLMTKQPLMGLFLLTRRQETPAFSS